MSRYNAIIPNDIVNGHGVCVSFFVQGCPHHCPGCFNEETWDFKGGNEYTDHTKWEIIEAIGANGIQRNFSVLGGEPLDRHNVDMVAEVLEAVRKAYPTIEIILWTGFELEEFFYTINSTPKLQRILELVDIIVDGPFIEERKDLTLKLRGSTNQHIWNKEKGRWEIIE